MSVRVNTINHGCLEQAFALLPPAMNSLKARAQILKIGLQESRYATRYQRGGGPARSYWQFETSGIRGVLTHRLTRPHALKVCDELGVAHSVLPVYSAMGHNDILGAAFARLNLWWNSAPLPKVTDEDGSWRYYLDCWRPGKPHEESWPELHKEVVDYLNSAQA